MAVVKTSKPLTLGKLATELGGATVNTRGAPPESTDAKDVEANVDQAALEAAIAAHTADPDFGQPTDRIAMRQARAKAQAVMAGTDQFTQAELQRAVAALIVNANR